MRRWSWSVLLTITLAACASQTPEPTATNPPPPTDTPTPTETPPPTDTPTQTLTPTPAPVVLSEDELLSILLDLDDLQTGFTSDETGTGPMTYESLIEQDRPITAEYLRSTGDFQAYEVSYERQSSLLDIAFVVNWAIVFAEDGLASDYLADFPTFFTQAELQRVSFEQLGEESIAYTASVDATGIEFAAYYVLMRRQNVAVVLQYGAPAGTIDLQEVEDYTSVLESNLDGSVR